MFGNELPSRGDKHLPRNPVVAPRNPSRDTLLRRRRRCPSLGKWKCEGLTTISVSFLRLSRLIFIFPPGENPCKKQFVTDSDLDFSCAQVGATTKGRTIRVNGFPGQPFSLTLHNMASPHQQQQFVLPASTE